MEKYIFTSESVTKGHPDKVCDIIADSILDAYLALDSKSRVAVETTVKNNTVILLGEISSKAKVDLDAVVRSAIKSIGYDDPALGFCADTANIIYYLDRQSPDIAMGVDNAFETRGTDSAADVGAGDQGMMFGYASDETAEFLPMPIALAHKLSVELTKARESKLIPYLRPDGKTQVSVNYVDGEPKDVAAVVVSAQHNPDVSLETLRADIKKHVIDRIIKDDIAAKDMRILINPTGRFVVGGPECDCGLTGRKLMVDTYGAFARHGGGAFSGKDPTKVDRSAAYAARYVAKNIVASKLARRCEIQIAYAIGVAKPVSVCVDTFLTNTVPNDLILRAVNAVFDLRPGAIITNLRLNRPIYAPTAAYGHFGRNELDLSWEQTDCANKLADFVAKNK